MRCSFCGKEIVQGTGKIFVLKTGKTLNFCSSKCERNMLVLKRKPHKVKWVSKREKKV
ncbi:MAG: 50S ribosomal protein L24e [Candidatus Diapherotrites archaeon]|nr:50S ribosomal protein L24e [Candidatus Diapherotrites archaeon]